MKMALLEAANILRKIGEQSTQYELKDENSQLGNNTEQVNLDDTLMELSLKLDVISDKIARLRKEIHESAKSAEKSKRKIRPPWRN